VNRARKAAAILLSTTVSLLATEVILRSFYPRRTAEVLSGAYPAMFKGSEVLPYRLRENYQGRLATVDFDTRVRINSLGYRGEDFTVAKNDARRVLVIGDSFTFGWGVNDQDTYPVRLQRLLSEDAPGKRVEVINAGFAACYSPDTYYLYLKTEGLALEPDLIIVGLFVGNDLDSQFAFENEWVEKDAGGLPARIRNVDLHVVDNYLMPRHVPLRYRTPLLSRSHVFQGLFDIWWELAPKIKAWLPGSVATTVYAQAPGADEGVPYIYRRQYSERTEGVFNRVRSLLAAMHRLAADRGIPIYVMVIPEGAQMSPNAYGLQADIEKPQKQLAGFFESEGIRYLDLLPVLREKSGGRPLYFPHDGHWNELGNELAAEALAGFVSKEWPRQ
jgi:lysophospholipase L1-like esterase